MPWPKQHILRLDIAVDQAVIVYILQRARDLHDDRQNGADWECSTLRKILLEIPTRGIFHHHERGTLVLAKIQDAHDVPMAQVSQYACLQQKALHLLVACPHEIQQFERHVGVEVAVRSQLDAGIAPLSKLANQRIVAKLLPV